MTLSQNIILMGLPESGKTTFLAALWHTIQSGEIDASFTLELSDNDMEYLNQIRREWLGFSKVSRNTQSTIEKVKINSLTSNQKRVKFEIPDFSGEIYRDIFESRSVDDNILSLMKNTDGVLFFIHPDSVNYPISILDEKRAMGDLSNGSESNEILNPFDIKLIPTCVTIVDLIQIMQLLSNNKLQIGIIISAWDKYLNLDKKITPNEWLKATLPLLDQYLQSNSLFFDYKVFGVSAQGGDYEIDSNLDLLKKVLIPSQRVIVEDGNTIINDITHPIKWLIKNHIEVPS